MFPLAIIIPPAVMHTYSRQKIEKMNERKFKNGDKSSFLRILKLNTRVYQNFRQNTKISST